MQYFSNDTNLKKLVNKIFDNELPSEGRVNFSVGYSQNKSMSIVVVEMSRTPIVHALLFFYNRSFGLFDVIRYKQKQWKRLGTAGKSIDAIHQLNKLILKKIPRSNQQGERRLKESLLIEAECVLQDFRIKSLKDQIRILRDQNQSLKNQIKYLKKKNNSQSDN